MKATRLTLSALFFVLPLILVVGLATAVTLSTLSIAPTTTTAFLLSVVLLLLLLASGRWLMRKA